MGWLTRLTACMPPIFDGWFLTNRKLYKSVPLSFSRLMKNIKLSKHDKYVLELSNKIKNNYDSISVNVPVKYSKRSLGEIDVLAKKGDRFDLYEVKCSYRILKAKKQLNRIKKYLNLKNARSYFYCGNSKLLVTV